MKIIWKPISGYSDYEVSNGGDIRNVKTGFVLNPPANGSGHRFVRITPDVGGKTQNVYVNKTVLSTFVGPRPEGLRVCHLDGDKSNCRLTNLCYDTQEAIMRRYWASGEHHQENIDEITKSMIVDLSARGHSYNAIQERLGITYGSITRIIGPRGTKAKKLTAEMVKDIKLKLAAGATQVSLAAVYGVSDANINQIATGKIWA